MIMTQVNQLRKYVAATRAARDVGISRTQVEKLGEAGFVGMLKLPGQFPRFDLADVRRVVEASLVPGKPPGNVEGRPPA